MATKESPRSARLMYPAWPDLLTPMDLRRLFTPGYDERRCAATVARTPLSQVALLVQLRVCQLVGRFRSAEEIPNAVIAHIAQRLGVDGAPPSAERTLYRHRSAILRYLGITRSGPAARTRAKETLAQTARSRTDPAELVNAAIDALIREQFELPALDTLLPVAAPPHGRVNAAQWAQVA